MTVAAESSQMNPSHAYAPLEGRFEVIKEIGDGSFGNVVLARVRAAGASVARRGTMVRCSAYSDLFSS
jgi:meiosis induction protein kinase IME2/SME1